MKIGFTGTQKGMTEAQEDAFRAQIALYHSDTEFHHGDCIGADADAHRIWTEVNGSECIILHPPESKIKRAFSDARHIAPAKPYLQRNHDIVDQTDCLIACPKEATEVLRSGTWATIRYAKKQGKKIMIILPDGYRQTGF